MGSVIEGVEVYHGSGGHRSLSEVDSSNCY